ncbi:MAG: class I SAM-dependent methyltransferase [Myxococcota bacterium]
MSLEPGDTEDRSLAHWSEARRAEMDAFYRVATLDYRELVRAWSHTARLAQATSDAPLRILDVACGSGKFPAALREVDAIQALAPGALVLDLLDPSSFSVEEAAASLTAPMKAGRRLVHTLQDLPTDARDYDVVWAVHALYALPEAELADGVVRFLEAMKPDGLGFIGHATRSSHYLAFYEAYLEQFRPDGTPYTSAEVVAQAFRDAGATVNVAPLRYVQVIHEEPVLEGFLQRCLFDETLSLEAMRADPRLGAYLAERTTTDGSVRFTQDVAMITIQR